MKKIGLLCLAVVLALGAMGVGYAHWSDTVTITQTVETGKVSIGFSKQMTGEPFGGEFENKDVGSISCQLIGPIKGYVYYGQVLMPVYTGMQVTMLNAYPCYQTAVWADVANVGNIPVKISAIDISIVRTDEVEVCTFQWLTPYASGVFKDSLGKVIITVDVVNLFHSQIHPGLKDVVEYDFHVLQAIQQDATYVITINITGTQWNLVP